MSKKRTATRLGQAELEVLKHVQEHAPVTVRSVAEHFDSLARTTILTVMERLRAKGQLKRQEIEGVYHYSPRIDRKQLMRTLVKQFVETTLGGEVSPFLAYLQEEGVMTEAEQATLRRLVRRLEGRGKEEKVP